MQANTIRLLLRRSDTVATYGILAGGVIHTSLSPVFKPQGGEDQLWFAGTGLALCLLGVLNLLRRAPDSATATRSWCSATNLASACFLVILARALRKPHIYAVLACVSWTTACSLTPSKALHRH